MSESEDLFEKKCITQDAKYTDKNINYESLKDMEDRVRSTICVSEIVERENRVRLR